MQKYVSRFIPAILIVTFTPRVFAQADASATGISRAFNPAISVNALFQASSTDRQTDLWKELGIPPGFHYQEVSVEMTSNVDVYLSSKIVLSASEAEGVGVEEAYVTTLSMPIPISIRAGLMLNTFGRHNLYHLHHMAFAETPMVLQQVFGPDLCEVGIEASYLLPFNWYSDLTVGIVNGSNEYLFNSEKKNDFAYLAHLDNLWDVSDETTIRCGGSYLFGNRGLQFGDGEFLNVGDRSDISSIVIGADFHLKWKPLSGGRYTSFVLQGEYVNAQVKMNDECLGPLHGFFAQAMYQFGLKWWVQGRYGWYSKDADLVGFFPEPIELRVYDSEDVIGKRISASIAYIPTEFSAFKIQYNYTDISGIEENQLVLQMNVTIGSHPAHKY